MWGNVQLQEVSFPILNASLCHSHKSDLVMDNATIERLESCCKLLAPRGAELVDQFYARLFAENPSVRPMFPESLADQKKKFLAAIMLVLNNIRNPEKLAEPLKKLGGGREGYGTKVEHYPVVRDVLIYVMSEMVGNQWNDQLTEDWTSALNFVASIMIEGQKEVQNGIRQAA